MSAVTVSVPLTFVVVICGGCGTVFGITEDLERRFQSDGKAIRCPMPRCDWGSMVPRESRSTRLQKELEEERKKSERAIVGRRWAENARDAEFRSHTATKGHLTRHRRRTAAGVCPCCHRTFKQLAAHMKRKHPGFPDQAEKVGEA